MSNADNVEPLEGNVYRVTFPDGTMAEHRTPRPRTHALIVQGIDSKVWFVREWTSLPGKALQRAAGYFAPGVVFRVVPIVHLGTYRRRPGARVRP